MLYTAGLPGQPGTPTVRTLGETPHDGGTPAVIDPPLRANNLSGFFGDQNQLHEVFCVKLGRRVYEGTKTKQSKRTGLVLK